MELHKKMKLIDVDIDGTVFKVQEGFSYVQQQEIMDIIEEYIDLSKLRQIQSELQPDEDLNLEHASKMLREGKKLMKFNFELSKYCLITFVKEPELTNEHLNDPDDPNADNYSVLGLKLSELALAHISKKALLKKTPTE